METEAGGQNPGAGGDNPSPARKAIDFFLGLGINLGLNLPVSAIMAVIVFILRLFTAGDGGHDAAFRVEMVFIPLWFGISLFPVGISIGAIILGLGKKFPSLARYRTASWSLMVLWCSGLVIALAFWLGVTYL